MMQPHETLKNYRTRRGSIKNLSTLLTQLPTHSPSYTKIKRDMRIAESYQYSAIRTIRALPPQQAQLLRLMYVDGNEQPTVTQLADQMAVSQATLYRLRIKALQAYNLTYGGIDLSKDSCYNVDRRNMP